jgi:hypothetical protein
MNYKKDLIKNIEKIHTTELGIVRIKRNLELHFCTILQHHLFPVQGYVLSGQFPIQLYVFSQYFLLNPFCDSYNFLIFATNNGTNPVYITIISHKFPVVILYAFIIYLNVFPIINPRTVSNIIVEKTHNNPIIKYVFLIPFPNRGINMKETKKMQIHKIIPLIGLAIFSPIQGSKTYCLKPPFNIARGVIESHINIDFKIMISLLLCNYSNFIYYVNIYFLIFPTISIFISPNVQG